MTTTLFKPQPLPVARLQPATGLLVLVLHVWLLWLANLYWPGDTVQQGAVQDAKQPASAPTVGNSTNRSFVASDADNHAVSNFGRQRFGRAEAMLALPQTAPQNDTERKTVSKIEIKNKNEK